LLSIEPQDKNTTPCLYQVKEEVGKVLKICLQATEQKLVLCMSSLTDNWRDNRKRDRNIFVYNAGNGSKDP
jgi:hypothetical protein